MAIGMCHICGQEREMTFEHIPPRRAFNKSKVEIQTLESLRIENEYGKNAPLKMNQGMGKRSLCEKCNGWTGAEYGEAFAEWTVQALRFSSRASSDARLLLPFEFEPLRES
jgi:hypothetical protein